MVNATSLGPDLITLVSYEILVLGSSKNAGAENISLQCVLLREVCLYMGIRTTRRTTCADYCKIRADALFEVEART